LYTKTSKAIEKKSLIYVHFLTWNPNLVYF